MKDAREPSTSHGCTLETLESRRMFAAGALDPTFGVGGKFVAPALGFDVTDVAVQHDGKIVAVGRSQEKFAVARLNADGRLDRTFAGGLITTEFGGKSSARSVVIQPNGKILVVGGVNRSDREDVALARFNPDGTPDTTFDGNGAMSSGIFGLGRANVVALQPDGKILIAGATDTGFIRINVDFAVARFLPNGNLDTTFGSVLPTGPGGATRRSGRMTIDFDGDSQQEDANVIAVAPDGKIVLGGIVTHNGAEFALARLKTNGSLDKSFDENGKLAQSIGGGGHLRDIAVEPDGRITAVGGTDKGNFVTARFTPDGTLDATLNNFGIILTDLGGNDEARSVHVTREGILVAGGSSGNFAMVRFNLKGKLDNSFGSGAPVTTPTSGKDAILTTTLTADGKIVAYGRSGSSARYFAATPKVNVFSLKPVTIEGGENGSLIFTRDIRASFATRVFYDLGGTATPGADYADPSRPKGGKPTRKGLAASGLVESGLVESGLVVSGPRFVDIPANQTIAIVPIAVTDDNKVEFYETAVATIRANAAYGVGERASQTITITDNEAAHINFQAVSTQGAAGYVRDTGKKFADRGNGLSYGWDANNAGKMSIRNSAGSPDFRYDSLALMQAGGANRTWEFAVPNGLYTVRIVAGDPNFTDSVYKMNLEGSLALSGTPGADTRWFRSTINVQVSDGRLTLTNAAGSRNNKIAFLDIKCAASGSRPGPVAPNLPVRLFSTATASFWHQRPDGLLSDNQIDDTTVWS